MAPNTLHRSTPPPQLNSTPYTSAQVIKQTPLLDKWPPPKKYSPATQVRRNMPNMWALFYSTVGGTFLCVLYESMLILGLPPCVLGSRRPCSKGLSLNQDTVGRVAGNVPHVLRLRLG